MKANIYTLSVMLVLSVLLALVGCREPQPQPQGQELKLSTSVITMSVGEVITVTRTGEGGAVEVTLPADQDFTLTSDNEQIAQVEGRHVKALAVGKATITVTSGDQKQTLTVSVQAQQQGTQKISLSPASLTVTVGQTVVFGPKAGEGVAVVVTTEPEAPFTLSTTETDKVRVEEHRVTALSAGTYTITVQAGDAQAAFELKVVEEQLEGTWIVASKQKMVFVPQFLTKMWEQQNALKFLVESESNYDLDHVDEAHKAIWFINRNTKAGKFAFTCSHVAYVLNPDGGQMPYIDAIYKSQGAGYFDLMSASLLDEVGADIDPNVPPTPEFDAEGKPYYELPHKTLPLVVRVFYVEREEGGKMVEDLYARLTPTIQH